MELCEGLLTEAGIAKIGSIGGTNDSLESESIQEGGSSMEQPNEPRNEGTQGSENRRGSGQELLDELNVLGHKFAEVVNTAWNSEERRKIQEDLRTGLSTLAEQLEDGLNRLADSRQAKDLLNKADDVADSLGERVRSSKFSQELAGNLATGLRSLSEQLDKLAREMQSRNKSSGPASGTSSTPADDDSQDIPINRE
jgi:uncharacterized phage infection (PIP) family protein YhgE